MAARADTPVIDTPQDPDIAIKLYHFWDVAHRIRRDPLVIHSSHKALELVQEEEDAFLNLQTVKATTDLGRALQLRAWAIYHGGTELLGRRHDVVGPQPFDKLLNQFRAADKEYVATDSEDQPLCDITHERRSNALFWLFTTKPETIGQAREILRAIVHEMRLCELTVGGPLPDAIELALGNILDLMDRADPNVGVERSARRAVRS